MVIIIGFPSLYREALVGGHYARLGRVIVHSVLQALPTFPSPFSTIWWAALT